MSSRRCRKARSSLADRSAHTLFALLCLHPARRHRQAADDLVHDCLERAVSRWHLRRAEGDLRGWLYTILYNRILTDKHRQRRGVADALLEVAETELPGVDGGQDWAPAHRDLLRAFAAFPRSNGRWCF